MTAAMSDDRPTFVTGFCRVTYYPTVLQGRPVIVVVKGKERVRRSRRKRSKARASKR